MPAPSHRSHGLVEFQRVGDAVAHEGVHLQPLVVGRQHFLLRQFQIEDAIVDQDHGFDPGQLEVNARLGDEAGRLAEAQDQRLLGLAHLEEGGEAQRQRERAGGEKENAQAHHWPPSGWLDNWPLGPGCGGKAPFMGSSGSTGRAPARSSKILSPLASTRSMVSR